MNRILPLHEEVMLLALKDEKGTMNSQATFYPQVMAGAILSELLLTEKIRIVDSKKQIVKCKRDKALKNKVLDEALKMMSSDRKDRNLRHWIGKLAAISKLKQKTAQSLCEKGILDEQEVKVLWVFNSVRYPEKDPNCEKKMIERLREAIFTNTGEVDARTATLISLTYKTGILSIPFTKKSLKKMDQRLKNIADGLVVSGVTREIIESIQTMIVMVAVMPAVIS